MEQLIATVHEHDSAAARAEIEESFAILDARPATQATADLQVFRDWLDSELAPLLTAQSVTVEDVEAFEQQQAATLTAGGYFRGDSADLQIVMSRSHCDQPNELLDRVYEQNQAAAREAFSEWAAGFPGYQMNMAAWASFSHQSEAIVINIDRVAAE